MTPLSVFVYRHDGPAGARHEARGHKRGFRASETGASQDQVEHRSPLTAPESKVDWGDWTIPKRPNTAQRDSYREMTRLTLSGLTQVSPVNGQTRMETMTMMITRVSPMCL